MNGLTFLFSLSCSWHQIEKRLRLFNPGVEPTIYSIHGMVVSSPINHMVSWTPLIAG